jgi:hypothetical protein
MSDSWWVDSIVYLSSCVSNTDGGTENDVIHKIAKAQFAFARLRRIWHMHKADDFNCLCEVRLLYGSETWYVKDRLASKLGSFFNGRLRNVFVAS